MAKVSLKYITKNLAVGKVGNTTRLKAQLVAQKDKQFWQLCGINLVINHAQILGLIGDNNGGRSLLLQIIAQKIHQTTGFITNKAKKIAYASIDELDENQTGMANIKKATRAFVNEQQAMHESQLVKQIAAFSELDRWLNYAVKYYSPGQKARLILAIALLSGADLVVVDDCLVNLDNHFKQKMITKLRELKQQNVAVVMTSNDLELLAMVCDQLAWLDGGKIVASGPTNQVFAQYQSKLFDANNADEEHKLSSRQAKIDQQVNFKIETLYETFKSEQFRHGYTRKDEPRMRKAFFADRGEDPVAINQPAKVVTKSGQSTNHTNKKQRRFWHLLVLVVICLCGMAAALGYALANRQDATTGVVMVNTVANFDRQ